MLCLRTWCLRSTVFRRWGRVLLPRKAVTVACLQAGLFCHEQVHWAADDAEGHPVLVVHLAAALQQVCAPARPSPDVPPLPVLCSSSRATWFSRDVCVEVYLQEVAPCRAGGCPCQGADLLARALLLARRTRRRRTRQQRRSWRTWSMRWRTCCRTSPAARSS